MTHARLPSSKVIDACDQAEVQIQQALQDNLELEERARHSGKNSDSTRMVFEAEENNRIDQLRRLRRVRTLAQFAEDGVIFVSAEDFQAFHGSYRL